MPDAELIEFQIAAISTDANYVICLAIKQLSYSSSPLCAAIYGVAGGNRSDMDPGYMSRKFESFERIISIRITNDNFESIMQLK